MHFNGLVRGKIDVSNYIQPPYIVYVKLDENNTIIGVNSSAFLDDSSGWDEIDRGYGDKYQHAQGNYFPLPIMDDSGVYRYKLVNGKPVERMQEEMDADYTPAEFVPTQLDRIEAQALYTALITDTIIEEV